MRAKDVLLEAIAAFSGTVVFVSHDRYFIDRLATRVLEVEGGAVTSHEGNYEDYLRWKEAQGAGKSVSLSVGSRSAVESNPLRLSPSSRNGDTAGVAAGPASTTIVIEGGFDSKPFEPGPKEKPRRLNPIKQKQMEERCAFLEEETPRIEAAIALTEEQLGAYVSAAETARLTALAEDLRAQLAALMAEWEELIMQLDGAVS
jgi:ATP-binding cassette subfamily F protein 3